MKCTDCQDLGYLGGVIRLGIGVEYNYCNCEAADELKAAVEAADYVESLHRARRKTAQRVRDLRKVMRQYPIDREAWSFKTENQWIKKIAYNGPTAPLKPTVENLACEAERWVAAGRAPLPWEANPHWSNPHSTEYYSACGYEDYLGDQREAAREHGLTLIYAVDYLIERS